MRLQCGLLSCATLLACHTSTDDGPPRLLSDCWSATVTGFSIARPAVGSSAVFAADGTGAPSAFERATGQRLWRTSLARSAIEGMNLLVANGVVVVPARDSTYGVDAATGTPILRYAAPLDVRENPVSPLPGFVGETRIATDGASVFVPAWGASVSAVDLRTGMRRWVWQPSDTTRFRSGSMGVRISGDTVYATAWHFLDASGLRTEQWLLALDRLSGREL
ncbi:MAG: PQQ-binding-like beta-propeller repeat protein [Gemmatimonadaceae bacterium]